MLTQVFTTFAAFALMQTMLLMSLADRLTK